MPLRCNSPAQARAHSLLKSRDAELRGVKEAVEAALGANLAEAKAALKQAEERNSQVFNLNIPARVCIRANQSDQYMS